MRRPAVALPLAALLVPAAPASAQPRLRLAVERVYKLNAKRIALQHQRVRVRGIVRDPLPGQVVRVRVTLDGGRHIRVRRRVRPRGARGTFSVDFRAHRRGRLRAFATAPGGLSARSRSVDVIARTADPGERGLHVVFLQHRLRDLRYLVGYSGVYDGSTRRAVLAYRKVNRLPRHGGATRSVLQRLARRRGRFRIRFPRHGKHVEADLSRQVLALADRGGRLFRVLIASSGTPSTPTVRGSFRVYSKTPGVNVKGMLHSIYFFGGYAIHGYPSVPTYPASHGCLRIPMANARFVFRWLDFGDRVDVYR